MVIRGTGWIPDKEDERDLTLESDEVQGILRSNGKMPGAAKPGEAPALPQSVDLRSDFPPVFDQGQLNSCTANTSAALLGYFEQRAFRNNIVASRLFIYKASRSLLKETGDNGAYLRTAMETLSTFGAPPEDFWPYVESMYDTEPPAFCYGLAANYKAVTYFRVDRGDKGQAVTGPDLLGRIRAQLAHGLPLMFGFSLYNSIQQADNGQGGIPFPSPTEKSIGLHAIVACGYDDTRKITNTSDATGQSTTGALLIRNSWGASWAIGGYAWLPYDYVLHGLTSDWWELVKADYLDTGQFGLPT